MDELVRWLGEQLDTDAARAAQWHDLECEIHTHMDGGLLAAISASRMLQDVPGAVCDCGGPARVLREIDARRQIVERYAWLREHGDTGGTAWVLPLLALPYADRPGYRSEWAPTV